MRGLLLAMLTLLALPAVAGAAFLAGTLPLPAPMFAPRMAVVAILVMAAAVIIAVAAAIAVIILGLCGRGYGDRA